MRRPRGCECLCLCVCCVRSLYVDAADTVLMAVEVRGGALLSWMESVLATPPFFYQTAGVAVGRDPDSAQGCRVNRLQVNRATRATGQSLAQCCGLVQPA